MSQHQFQEEDPPGLVVRIPPTDRRDVQGRTLDQALYADQVAREAEWELRLKRAYWPLSLLDWSVGLFAPGMFVMMLVCAIASQLGFDGWVEMGFRLLMFWFVAFILYWILNATILAPWMRKRLDRIRAAAREEGIELTGDPMGQFFQITAGSQ